MTYEVKKTSALSYWGTNDIFLLWQMKMTVADTSQSLLLRVMCSSFDCI